MSFNLPELPDGWRFASLESCAEKGSISYGVVQPGSAVTDGVPIIRVNNFKDMRIDLTDVMRITPEIESKYGRTRLAGGEVLLTLVGSVGQVAIVPKAMAGFNVARAVCVIHPLPHINPNWISLCLRSPLAQHLLGSRANTTVQTTINLKDVRALPIPIPPENERHQITDMLAALEDRIALLRETNTTLEAIAQALFKFWFVDFDPVHAKQQGREPEGMDATSASLFPDSFEESELGLVPKGWQIKSIGDISQILNGFAFKSEDYVTEDFGVFVLRTTNFSDDGYAKRLDKDVFLPTSFLKSHEKFICEPFDFHLVMVGASVGRTSTLLPNMLPALRNQNMWCFRQKDGFPSKFFVHEIVKLNVVDALRSTSGSAREFFRKGDFEKNKLVLPCPEILSDFENKVSVIKNKIAVNEKQCELLVNIRDALLPRLMSGQLRLPVSGQEMNEIAA